MAGEEKLAGAYTVATTATPVNGLSATTAHSTTNTNATTALPAETVTDHYVQDQLSIVDSTLNQAYLRGATYTPFGQLAQAQLGNLGTLVTQTLGYDLVTQRLATSITDRQAAGPKTLSNIKYSYDTVGNLTPGPRRPERRHRSRRPVLRLRLGAPPQRGLDHGRRLRHQAREKVAAAAGVDDLSPALRKSLTGFMKKSPGDAEIPEIIRLPEGGAEFSYKVPGRVPGSFAIYRKRVDVEGVTELAHKTTWLPGGTIAHVNFK
ncbi:hypothetical protein [Streptomyces sp. NRRL S-340]|uniref:hypothetical protein n=1 Tax=Streptomyces sp. NRRL S-340 TaxID=1463901 RepID=UPI00056CC162|nr:hypothetical protein [Streptomyces sp. NRRL S-340]